MSSLRMRALEYIAANGNHMPYQDVAAGLKENPQKVRGALGDASKDGYLSFGRDDVSGQGGYSLTAKGKARIVNVHQTINGKQASENKKACDKREAAAHVMSAPVDDEAMPEPDPAFLAAANRMLGEQNQKLQKHVEGLEQDREKQRTLLASKTERIAKLEEENAELQDCTADDLTATVARLIGENAALRKEAADWRDQLAEAQRGLKDWAVKWNTRGMNAPMAYAHVWPDGLQQFDSEEAARADIEQSFQQSSANDYPSYLCAILDKAERTVKWARS